MRVEDAVLPGDVDALLALNNAAVPAVNHLDDTAFLRLAAMGRIRLVRVDGVLGFVLTLPAGTPYESLNYHWFNHRYRHFLYVDRIVVSEAARGRGVGRLLYEDAIAQARATAAGRVCSEVNLDPPNPGSFAFHDTLGFTPLCARPNDGKTVAMMVRELGEAGAVAVA